MSKINNFVLVLLFSFICMPAFCQIIYEPGYVVKNDNSRVECLIKNLDWLNNPLEIEYKIAEQEESQKATVNNIREFCVYGESKYISTKVKIDRSPVALKDLDHNRMPEFSEEQLFLKVLVEGEASLYIYSEGQFVRFFYKKKNSAINQLVYKEYLLNNTSVAKNEQYKQILMVQMSCPEYSKSSIEHLQYNQRTFVKYFLRYNAYYGSDVVNYVEKQMHIKNDVFNLSVRPGITSNFLLVQSKINRQLNTGDIKGKIGYRVGVEAEFFLPFNKNKWSFFVEPYFQSFSCENVLNRYETAYKNVIFEYKSIRLPVGVRYYSYLPAGSCLFFDGSYLVHELIDNSVQFISVNLGQVKHINVDLSPVFVVGFGCKFKKRISAEFQYQIHSLLAKDRSTWNSDYKTLSFIVGYTFF